MLGFYNKLQDRSADKFVILVLMMVTSSVNCRQFGGLQQPLALQLSRGGAAIGTSQTESKTSSTYYLTNNPLLRKVCKYTDELFDKLDENSDGVLSFDEVYEIMLLVSIKVNRQAPIPPPTKETARILFKMSDLDKSGKLTKDELKKIVLLSMPRTTARLVSHKILSLAVAPMLALKTVAALDGNVWFEELGKKWVPEEFHHIVLTKDFWKLALTVAFVSVLGSLVIEGISWVYDAVFKLRPVSDSKKDK